MAHAKILYKIDPRPNRMTDEERSKIKEIISKNITVSFPFVGSHFFVAAEGEVSPEGIEGILNDIKKENLRCDGLTVRISQEPVEYFLKKVPEPYSVKLVYEPKN